MTIDLSPPSPPAAAPPSTPDHLRAQWADAWRALGAPGDGRALCDALLACYQEPQRHYHTLRHLGECLDWLQRLQAQAVHPGQVAMALWFHDAVYDPGRHDNEARSADWAGDALRAHGVTDAVARRVRALVLDTRHDVPAAAPGLDPDPDPDPDRDLVRDIDLAILGARPQRFAEYGRQIRAEYAFVPLWIYRRRRRAVLAAFAARATIYATAPLRQVLEAQARHNLAQALGRPV